MDRRTLLTLAALSAVECAAADRSRVRKIDDFGASGSGTIDDSTALQRALDSGKPVYLRPGKYLVGDLLLRPHSQLVGAGPATELIQIPGSRYLISANPGTLASADPTKNIQGVRLRNIRFVGRSAEAGFAEHVHIINLNGVTDCQIEECELVEFQGDAIYLGSGNMAGHEAHNVSVRIRNCRFLGGENRGRNAISVIDCMGLLISNCTFIRTSRQDMPGAVDIEPDDQPFHRVSEVDISGNTFLSASGAVGAVCIILSTPNYHSPPGAIRITGNRIDCKGNGNGITVKRFLEGRPNSPMGPVLISGNDVVNTVMPMLISGVRNVRVGANRLRDSIEPVQISLRAHGAVEDISITDNSFEAIGLGRGPAIRVNDGSAILIARNKFTRLGSPNPINISPQASGQVMIES